MRTEAERARQPRNLERLLGELRPLRAAGVGGDTEAAVRGALLGERNEANQIPAWLGGNGRLE